MRPVPQVLIPWNPDEAITVAQAAVIARCSSRTVREWAARYDVGRRVVGGPWMLSRVALTMLLENDTPALARYLTGDRQSHEVARYFSRLRIGIIAESSAMLAKAADPASVT